MTNVDKYKKIVIPRVKSVLKNEGFKIQNLRFIRLNKYTTDGFHFQTSRFNGIHSFKFHIDMGVNWNAFRMLGGDDARSPNSFTMHCRLEKLAMKAHPELNFGWIISDETDPIIFSTFLLDIIMNIGLSYIKKWNDIDYVSTNIFANSQDYKNAFLEFAAKHKANLLREKRNSRN